MYLRLTSSDSRTNRLVLVSPAIILALISLSFTPAPRNYVESLVMLNGTGYWQLNCAQYICAAKRHRECPARSFWENGCDGDALVVQDVASFDDVDTGKLLPGDVVAFHGVHVAAFIGNRTWMDSDCRHDGVGIMRPNRRKGGWFYGEVRILRWKE
jgi:hypothetical protein